MVIVIWAGGLQAIRGSLTVGQIVAFTNYLLTTMTPLIMMTMLSNIWAGGIASAGRVDEVLDTVPEVAGRRRMPSALPRGRPGPDRLRRRLLPLQRRQRRAGAGGHQPGGRAGPDGGHPGRDRRGQVHAGQPGPALLRRHRRPGAGRRGRRPRSCGRITLLAQIGDRAAGDAALLGHGARQHPLRRPDASEDEVDGRGQGGAGARLHPGAARRATTRHVEERGVELLRRAEAAHRHRPRAADAGPRS